MPDIITPIIHMNGSGKRALIDQLCTAYRAVVDAMDAPKRLLHQIPATVY